MAEPDFYQRDAHVIKQTSNKQQKLTSELEIKYQRWDELDN
jgi:hypothetical protein